MARLRRRPIGALFALLAAAFVGLAAWAGSERQWVVTATAGAIGIWMAELAYRTQR